MGAIDIIVAIISIGLAVVAILIAIKSDRRMKRMANMEFYEKIAIIDGYVDIIQSRGPIQPITNMSGEMVFVTGTALPGTTQLRTIPTGKVINDVRGVLELREYASSKLREQLDLKIDRLKEASARNPQYAELRGELADCRLLSLGFASCSSQMILKSAGYEDSFDFYEANVLTETDDKATGFTLNIYKNKAELLLRIVKDRDLDPKKTAYLGDSLDDAGCFEVIGHPIVSFLTPEGLKQRFAQQYNAFIPKDESDLARYLQNI